MGFDLINFLCASKKPSLCDAKMAKALTFYFLRTRSADGSDLEVPEVLSAQDV